MINKSLRAHLGRQSKPHYLSTPRQHDVYLTLLNGVSNKLILECLEMAPATVKKHLEDVYNERDMQSRAEIVMPANDVGVRD